MSCSAIPNTLRAAIRGATRPPHRQTSAHPHTHAHNHTHADTLRFAAAAAWYGATRCAAHGHTQGHTHGASRPHPRGVATPLAGLPTPTPNLLAAAAVGGPSAVSIVAPPAGLTSRNREEFAWTADAELIPGQVFEVAFWLPGQGPEDGVGWTEATIGNSLSAKLYEQAPGTYYWGVWLGTYIDGAYYRLRYLGGNLPIEVAGEPVPTAPRPFQAAGGVAVAVAATRRRSPPKTRVTIARPTHPANPDARCLFFLRR